MQRHGVPEFCCAVLQTEASKLREHRNRIYHPVLPYRSKISARYELK